MISETQLSSSTPPLINTSKSEIHKGGDTIINELVRGNNDDILYNNDTLMVKEEENIVREGDGVVINEGENMLSMNERVELALATL